MLTTFLWQGEIKAYQQLNRKLVICGAKCQTQDLHLYLELHSPAPNVLFWKDTVPLEHTVRSCDSGPSPRQSVSPFLYRQRSLQTQLEPSQSFIHICQTQSLLFVGRDGNLMNHQN